MNLNEYVEQSARTESSAFHPSVSPSTLHGAIGLSGEAGEILDCLKKTMFYGRQLDIENLREEIGDTMWYIACICRSESFDLEEILQENIDKLKLRYPEKFTTEHSIKRLDKND